MGTGIIFNADDFGSSIEVNEAVERAHKTGVLTSTSLMVTGAAFEDAVCRARTLPGLAVGLHLTLTDGFPAAAPAEVLHIIDKSGCFQHDPTAAGLHFFFSPACRQELPIEIRAQFERFAATGLRLSHVDGHQHIHIHPVVFAHLLPLALEFQASGIRIPRTDLRSELECDRHGLAVKAYIALQFKLLSRACLRRMRSYPIEATDRVYGLLESGSMHEDYVINLLHQMDEDEVKSVEFYFHPSLADSGPNGGSNSGDFKALTSAKVRSTIEERGLHLASYRSLRNGGSQSW